MGGARRWIGRARVPVAMALLLLSAACGEPSVAARPGPAAVPLRGVILSTGQAFGVGLRSVLLPSLRTAELTVLRDRFDTQTHLGAAWLDEDTAIAFGGTGEDRSVRRTDSQLFAFEVNHEARPIGDPIFGVVGFAFNGRTVMATTCASKLGHVLVLDVDDPGRWRDVGRSCVAALSLDGDRVAFVRNQWEIWVAGTDGGPPRRVADLTGVEGIRSGVASNVGASALSWGEEGLAVQIGEPGGFDASSRSRLVVVRESGEVIEVPLPPQSILLPPSAWQPGGSLLAFICRPSSGGALVRLFDATTRDVRVVAADDQFFGDVTWSPDGRVLVSATSINAMLFYDTDGNWIRRAAVGGQGVFDWAT
jgi:WD40 repeat protein